MAQTLSFDIAGGPSGPAAARRAFAGLPGVDEPVRRRAALLLSELVANAVIHGGVGADGRIGVSVSHAAGALRVEVADPGAGFSHDGPAPARDGGFGLVLVERLADRWGIDRGGGRTRVWFELGS